MFLGNFSQNSFDLTNLIVKTKYYCRIDQCDAAGKVINSSQLYSFSTESGNASAPIPADDYLLAQAAKYVLKWTPGKYALKQNIYFGSDSIEVMNKNKPDVEGLPANQSSVSLPAKKSKLGQKFYWRVETINRNKLPISSGITWSFRPVKKKVKVYLLGGQSNAVGCSSQKGLAAEIMALNRRAIIFIRGEAAVGDYGWDYLKGGLGSAYGDRDGCGTFGPELTFGLEMCPDSDQEVIAILKCAWGGTNLGDQWRPPSAGGSVGPLYTNFVKAYHEGMDSLAKDFEPELAGMIWMQGEADSGNSKFASEYATNLICFIKDIRKETKTPHLPFVIGQIAVAPAWDNPPACGPQIRAAQIEVARTLPYTTVFATDDYGFCDPWHYDTPGMKSLGARFAKSLKNILKKNK